MAKSKISELELVSIVDRLLKNALGRPDGKLASDRKLAYEYYRGDAVGRLAPPEVDGRSQYVSRDVAQTVDWLLPSLIEVFASSDEAVVFEPQNQEDEEGAKQATIYANYVFYRQNEGFRLLYSIFKDALIGRLGIAKIWWEEKKDDVTDTYRGLSEDELAAMMTDASLEIMARSEPYLNAVGVPVYDVKLKKTKDCSKICIEAVPPEEFLFSPLAKGTKDGPFFAHRVRRSISDLRAMGYDNVDNLAAADGDMNGEFSMEAFERKAINNSQSYGNTNINDTSDESMRQVWVTESYLRVDYDGDGIAEWRKVVKSGATVLENAEVDGHPFVAITPDPTPHEMIGASIADKVMDIQEIKTALIRQILDNAYLTNNSRHLYNKNADVDLDALLDNRQGGMVGTNDMEAVRPLVTPPLAPQTFSLLEYAQGDAENRSGVTRYNQGMDANSLNKTATGINAIMTASQQRQKLIARVFAEGVREIFQKILQMASKYDNKAKIIRLTNNYVQVDPSTWSNQFDVTINVGIGTGNKDQMAAHLTNVLQVQREALQIGIATPKNIYNAATKLVENMGFKNTAQYFTDPGTQPPQQTQGVPPEEFAKLQQQVAEMTQQNAMLKQQVGNKQAEYQLKAGELHLKDNELAIKDKESTGKLMLENKKLEQQAMAQTAFAQPVPPLSGI